MILAKAPLRISLGGGGTDLPSYYREHGGFIFSVGIDKYVYICVNRPAADGLLRVKYSRYEQVVSVDEIQHDLVRPALKLLELNGSLEIASMGDVPDGTGLGSSGSYLVALLTALMQFKKQNRPAQEIAELACHIEIDLAGHPVGKHDHYIAAFGGFTCFEIDRNGKVEVERLDLPMSTIEALRNNLMLFYTGIVRSSSVVLGDQKRETESGDQSVLESLHQTKELGYRIKAALLAGDTDGFGCLLHEHWENKKKRSAKITHPQIDHWYDVARTNGALGGKIIGAGGGGFLLVYCRPDAKGRVRQALTAENLREMPFDFDLDGARVLVNFR